MTKVDFFEIYWPAFVAALTANLLTAIIIYALVSKQRGDSTGTALLKAGAVLLRVSGRAVQIYLGLIVFGAIAYAIKLSLFG